MESAQRAKVGAAVALTMLVSLEARAQMAEDHLEQATDGVAGHLFTVNPAVRKTDKAAGGALLLRDSKETKLNQSATGNDTITSKTNDDYLVAAAGVDLGAGAGVSVSHQTMYRKVLTDISSRQNSDPVQETMKIQHSQLRLLVELTDEIRAGMAIRYLYKDMAIYGDPSMQGRNRGGEPTRFRTTLVGYGAGFAYANKQFGLGYAYYPPLRGKTEVEGEEKIVVERGQIAADGYYHVNKTWTGGLVYKRWINEIDDLATGTTAADNQTRISLYGLDLDQYLFPVDLVMAGADADLNKQTGVRVSVGRETSEFNFKDLMRYNRITARNGGKTNETITYYRLRAAVKFTNQGIEIDAGAGLFTRKLDFPESMNSGKYESSGKEVFAAISVKL